MSNGFTKVMIGGVFALGMNIIPIAANHSGATVADMNLGLALMALFLLIAVVLVVYGMFEVFQERK